ncbi:MAG: PilZ domain-containing protein [Kofleriaceae bacterium]
MVERPIETHASIVGENQSRTWRACRSQRHRVQDVPVPVLSRTLAIPTSSRFESEWRPTPLERRRSGRVRSTGTAIVHGSFAVRARILDLAIGGLSLLVDDLATAPDVGTRVRLDVRLDGLGRWLHLVGSVARVDARGPGAALAVELLAVPADFEDIVQDELLSALECARQQQILLVDGVRKRRELVATAFRAKGYHVIEVSSSLEAIAAIDQSRLHLWAVVIADTKLAWRADELRKFLAEAYPQVPLIVVGERVRRYGTTRISIDRIPDLALQIDNLVGMRELGLSTERGSAAVFSAIPA